MNAAASVVLFGASAALLFGCSGGGDPVTTFTPPPPVTFAHVFPAGDANGTRGTGWDIIGVRTTLSGRNPGGAGNSYDTLRVDVTFAQAISNALPSPGTSLGLGSQLGVAIGFDTDGKRSTGFYSFCDLTLADRPYEFVTDDSERLVDGNYAILAAGDQPIVTGPPDPQAEARTVVEPPSVFSQTIDLGNIGVNAGSAVPHVGVAVLALNANSGTDCVPGPRLEMFTDRPDLSP